MKLLHDLSNPLDGLDRNTLTAMWTLSGAFPQIQFRIMFSNQWQFRLYDDETTSWDWLSSQISSWSRQIFIEDYRRTEPEPDLAYLQSRIIHEA